MDIQRIKRKLIEDGHAGEVTNYEEFKKMHQQYQKGMPQLQFAIEILEVTENSFRKCKSGRSNMIILKQYIVKIDDQKKKEIQKEIASQENINEGMNEQVINRLYQVYGKGMQKKEFIIDILEITQEEWKKGQQIGKEFFILRKYSRKQKIKEELVKERHAGEKWNNKECEKFYNEKGKGIPEIEFYIDVLEVSKIWQRNAKERIYARYIRN